MADYTTATAEADPIVQAAVAAAHTGVQQSLQVIQAKALSAAEASVRDTLRTTRVAIIDSVGAVGKELEEVVRAQTLAAATKIAGEFKAMREPKGDTLPEIDAVEDDLPPYRGEIGLQLAVVPETLSREQPGGPPASGCTLPYGQTWGETVVTCQIWDVYGDCAISSSRGGNVLPSIKWPTNLRPIGTRPKLTREYQEIMWVVARHMDASFLRPIFDKYNPRAADISQLKASYADRCKLLLAREKKCDERDATAKARDEAADARDADAARRDRHVAEAARKSAERAEADKYEKDRALLRRETAALAAKEAALLEAMRQQEEKVSAREAELRERKNALDAQTEAATLRLKAATQKEKANKQSTEASRKKTKATAELADLREGVRRVARELCSVADIDPAFAARLLALVKPKSQPATISPPAYDEAH